MSRTGAMRRNAMPSEMASDPLAMERDERAGNNLWREIKAHRPNHTRSWNPCYESKLIGSTHLWRTRYNFPCHTVPVFKQGSATVRAHRPGISCGERCYPDQSTTSRQGRVGHDTPLRAIPVLDRCWDGCAPIHASG